MPLCASCEFDVPALIWRLLVNVCPSLLNAPQNCASSFGTPSVSPAPPVPRSLRESYQTTAIRPLVGSSESFGRNWLFLVASSLTRTGALQVLPESSEKRTETSVWALSFFCSC